MRRIVLGLALLVSFLPGCKGESPVDKPSTDKAAGPAPAKSAPAPAENTAAKAKPAQGDATKADGKTAGPPFLWSIDTDAGRSYLFGTMHLGVSADEDIHPTVWTAFAATDHVVLEIESSSIDLAQTQELLFLPDGQSLRKGLSDKQWIALKENVSGFPEDQLGRLSPLMASVLISTKWLPAKPPLDQTIEARARSGGKTVAGLETFEETKVFAQSIAHVKYLGVLLDDIEKAKKELRAMHSAYLEGNRKAMTDLVFSEDNMEKFPKLYQQLFYQRNKAWVSKIDKKIAAGKVFVAVGAGHLLGEKSVIALLRQRGYKVELVRPKP